MDEAHHVAPSSPPSIAGGRGYAIDTQRTVAVRQLADKCEHRLFLSATPHNGHPESFTALLEMIDSRRFSRGALLDAAALQDITVRRLKRDLAGKGFKNRIVDSLTFTPRQDEEAMFELLDDIVTRSAKLNSPQARKRGEREATSPFLSRVARCDDCEVYMCRGTNQKRPVLYCPVCRQTLSRTTIDPYLVGRLLEERGAEPLGAAAVRACWDAAGSDAVARRRMGLPRVGVTVVGQAAVAV
ncbi:MAG: hypothetical protein U0Q07_06630 [Acidimicrobiales bacterium]